MNSSVGNTAAISLGTSSTAGVLHWIFQCYMAHTLLMPDETVLIILAGFIAPVAHSVRDKIVSVMQTKSSVENPT